MAVDTTDAVHGARIADVIASTLEAVHGRLDDDGIAAVQLLPDLGWVAFSALAEVPGVPSYAVRANTVVLLRKRAAAQDAERLASVTQLVPRGRA